MTILHLYSESPRGRSITRNASRSNWNGQFSGAAKRSAKSARARCAQEIERDRSGKNVAASARDEAGCQGRHEQISPNSETEAEVRAGLETNRPAGPFSKGPLEPPWSAQQL